VALIKTMINIFQIPPKWDFQILEIINNFHRPFLDTILVFISNIGEYAIIWLIIGLFLLFFDKKNGKIIFVTLAIALIIEVIINDGILKTIFYRERPYVLFTDLHHLGPNTANSSFVSGHTASSIAAFLVLIKSSKKIFYLLLPIVLLMIWTRFYLGMHYPSDVISGIIVGYICATLAFLIGKKVLKFKYDHYHQNK